MNVKNIIFDIGGILANSKSRHWFITINFWNIIDKNKVNVRIIPRSEIPNISKQDR